MASTPHEIIAGNNLQIYSQFKFPFFDFKLKMSTSNPNYVWGWLYYGGNIIHDSRVGSAYDRDVVCFVKLNFDLKYLEFLNIVYKKLSIDPNFFKLKISRRFMNPTTRKYGVVLILDDDDLEFMFETLDGSGGSKVRVDLYIEEVSISSCQASMSSLNEGSANTSSTHGSKSVEMGSDGVSRGSSSRNLFLNSGGSSGSSSKNLLMSSGDSHGNSRGSSEFTDDDIPYYRTFDGTSMVVSNPIHGMEKIGELQNPAQLTKGMVFESKEKLLSVIKKLHIENHQEIKVVRSNPTIWEVTCKHDNEGCRWSLRARKRKSRDYFEIMETKGPHTCQNQFVSQDHGNLSSSYIAEIIINLVAADPTVSEKVLMAAIVREVGYTPSSKKVRDGKKIAMQKLYGAFDTSYQELPHLMAVLQTVNQGTHVDWYFKEHDQQGPLPKV